MECEICGRSIRTGERVRIEGAVLTACRDCAGGAERIGPAFEPRPSPLAPAARPPERPEEEVVPDVALLVRRARESKGLNHKELAERLNERESVLLRIEAGRMVPPLDLARRMERFLGITLVAIPKDEDLGASKSPNAPLTLGDVVKVRKRE